MQTTSNTMGSLVDRLEEYSKSAIKLLILKALEKISEFVSSSLPKLAAIFALLLIFLIRAWVIAL